MMKVRCIFMKWSRMKFLKHLCYILFILGLFCEPLQAKVIKISAKPCYSIGQEWFAQSEEIKWVGLLYVKESDKLARWVFTGA